MGLPTPHWAFRLYESLVSAGKSGEDIPGFPPAKLRMRVTGSPEMRVFVHGGELAFAALTEALESIGRPLAGFGTTLDFGCGCGRVLRLIPQDAGRHVTGVDVDRECVEWCSRNFQGWRFETVEKSGGFPLQESSIELCYAFSVVTHLDVALQSGWLAEVHRVLRDGGIFLCSTHGDACVDRLSEREAAEFGAGRIVVRSANANTSNLCNSFHPPAAFRSQISGLFQVIRHIPKGALGNAPQDLWILEKRTGPQV